MNYVSAGFLQLASFRADELVKSIAVGYTEAGDPTDVSLLVGAELIDPRDGHLGYTQLLRLCEVARFLAWRNILAVADTSHINDCTVVRIAADFRRPIDAAMVALRSRLLARGRTSFEMEVCISDVSRGPYDARFVITLVALGADGTPTSIVRAARDGP